MRDSPLAQIHDIFSDFRRGSVQEHYMLDNVSTVGRYLAPALNDWNIDGKNATMSPSRRLQRQDG